MSTVFSYTVVDRSGRKLKGQIDASNRSHAVDQLRQRGDTVLEIDAASASPRRLKLESSVSLSERQLADFAFELKTLVASGIPLPRALGAIGASHGSTRASALARDLKLQLELGGSASAALGESRSTSMALFGRFLAAAERGGRYDIMLGLAADFLTQRAASLERIRSALAYPLFLVVASLAAIIFLTVYVAPSLAPMFAGGEMPPFIGITSTIGGWVQANLQLSLAISAALTGLIYLATRQRTVRSAAGRLGAALPFVRDVVRDLDFGPATLAYAALLKSGWPAEQAVRIAADIGGGRSQPCFQGVSTRLRDGATLPMAFKGQAGMPSEIVRAIEIGEETGTVPLALQRSGELLLARGLKSIDRGAAVLGPIMIAVIGGLVALVMISMLSSISSLSDAAI